MKAHRETGILQVLSLVFEPGFTDFDELLPQRAAKLHDFAVFNGCQRVALAHVTPKKALPALKMALKALSSAQSSQSS